MVSVVAALLKSVVDGVTVLVNGVVDGLRLRKDVVGVMVVEMVVLKLVVAEDMIVLVDDTVVLLVKVVEGVWLVSDNGDVVCVVDSVLLPVVGVAVLLVSVVDVVAELVSRVVDGV